MRGDGGVAGEGRLLIIKSFISWRKCIMAPMNVHLDAEIYIGSANFGKVYNY